MSNSNNSVRYLNPVDSRKSFYGKAYEYEDSFGNVVCVSYTTRVAWIDREGQAHVKGLYSATTTRHIKSFLTAHGFPFADSKDIVKRYCAQFSRELRLPFFTLSDIYSDKFRFRLQNYTQTFQKQIADFVLRQNQIAISEYKFLDLRCQVLYSDRISVLIKRMFCI